MSRIKWYGPTLILLGTVLCVMIAGPSIARKMAYNYQDQNIQLVRESLDHNSVLEELSRSFRQIATVVEPSVVHIQVSARRVRARADAELPNDPEGLFERFFGPRLDPRFGRPDDQQQEPQRPQQNDFDRYNPARPYGNGSGWVYDNDGHIVTNNHVIDGADIISIRFHDGTERKATVVGTDPKTDIAVLKVEGGNLHPAIVASQAVQQGDIVFAFGSPFGFKFSMSQGIVSAVGRNTLGIIREGYENFIQTDAAINPGNSGGPLTDIHGEIVGMNTAIASNTGASNGLGFAIPASSLVDVVDSLINNGKVTRGFLGIQIGDLDARMASTFGYEGRGVLVINPIPGTPGELAGLKEGDIIVKLDGQPMNTADQLRNTVAGTKPNTVITLDVFRDQKHVDVKVTVGELPEVIAQAQGPEMAPPTPEEKSREVLLKLGLERLAPVTPQSQSGSPVKGLQVRSVRRDSAAAVAGIMPGAIITQVMGTPVSTVDELAQQLNKYDLTKGVRLRIQVQDQSFFVVLQLTAD